MKFQRKVFWASALVPAMCGGLALVRLAAGDAPPEHGAPAEAPRQGTVDISFQGRFVDTNGLPLEGNHDLYFRILDEVGVPRYTTAPVDPVQVTLVNGVATTAIPSVPVAVFAGFSLSGSPYRLEVSVDKPDFTEPFDVDLLPTPFAVKADNADTVDGSHASDFAAASHTHTGADIDDRSITGDDLANDSVTVLHISVDAVGSNEIAAHAVGTDELADGAVGSAQIADNSLTAADIATDVVSSIDGVTNDGGDIDLVAGSNITIESDIPANTIIISSTADAIPSGVIVMWSGSIADKPAGWSLCDGTDGTPDLRDRFIVGAREDSGGVSMTRVKGVLQQTGGEHEHVLTVAEIPPHTHDYEHVYHTDTSGSDEGWIGRGLSSYATSPTGGGGPHENCPPFYSLAFIMKE